MGRRCVEKYFAIAAAIDSAVASGASIATGKPAFRNAAAVTGPTAASAAFAPSRERTSAPSSPRRFSTADGLKNDTTSTLRFAHGVHHSRFDRADAARMIRHDFRDFRAGSLQRIRQVAPGAFAARQQDSLSRKRRAQFPSQRRPQKFLRHIIDRESFRRRGAGRRRADRRAARSSPSRCGSSPACGSGPQKNARHSRW